MITSYIMVDTAISLSVTAFHLYIKNCELIFGVYAYLRGLKCIDAAESWIILKTQGPTNLRASDGSPPERTVLIRSKL